MGWSNCDVKTRCTRQRKDSKGFQEWRVTTWLRSLSYSYPFYSRPDDGQGSTRLCVWECKKTQACSSYRTGLCSDAGRERGWGKVVIAAPAVGHVPALPPRSCGRRSSVTLPRVLHMFQLRWLSLSHCGFCWAIQLYSSCKRQLTVQRAVYLVKPSQIWVTMREQPVGWRLVLKVMDYLYWSQFSPLNSYMYYYAALALKRLQAQNQRGGNFLNMLSSYSDSSCSMQMSNQLSEEKETSMAWLNKKKHPYLCYHQNHRIN